MSLIAVIGDGCAKIEDEINELTFGDGSDDTRFITTSSHPDDPLDEVVDFATMWRIITDGLTHVVRI